LLRDRSGFFRGFVKKADEGRFRTRGFLEEGVWFGRSRCCGLQLVAGSENGATLVI